MKVFQAVTRTIREELKTSYNIPSPLITATNALHKVHLYYRTYQLTSTRKNKGKRSPHQNPAIYGAALQLFSDTTTIGSYVVNIALVTKCTQDLLKEYQKLETALLDFRHAVSFDYPIYHAVKWKTPSRNSKANIFAFRLQIQFLKWKRRILLIVQNAFKILQQMFKVSMSLCDAYYILDGHPAIRFIACTELVANWESYQNALTSNLTLLKEEIAKTSALSTRILTKLGLNNQSIKTLHEFVKETKEETQTTTTLFHGIQEALAETVSAVFPAGKIAMPQTAVPPRQRRARLLTGKFPPWTGSQCNLAND